MRTANFTIAEGYGLGNGFVIVDTRDHFENNDPSIFKKEIIGLVQEKRVDTALILSHSINADIKMQVLESDGTFSTMCGNGIRVVGKFIYETNGIKDLRVETGAGILETSVLSDGRIFSTLGRFSLHGSYSVGGYMVYDTDVGEPHAIVMNHLSDEVSVFDKLSENLVIRPMLLGNRSITRNLNIVKVNSYKSYVISVRTFERGVNRETLACGTGSACSAAIYAQTVLMKYSANINVKTLSGDLLIGVNGDYVTQIGPAKLK